jgi:hypothetical protein
LLPAVQVTPGLLGMAVFAKGLPVIVNMRVIIAAFEYRGYMVNLDGCALLAGFAKGIGSQYPVADRLQLASPNALNGHKKSPGRRGNQLRRQ